MVRNVLDRDFINGQTKLRTMRGTCEGLTVLVKRDHETQSVLPSIPIVIGFVYAYRTATNHRANSLPQLMVQNAFVSHLYPRQSYNIPDFSRSLNHTRFCTARLFARTVQQQRTLWRIWASSAIVHEKRWLF